MVFIGVDPGKNGGIAAIDEDRRVLFVVKMPETDQGVLDVFNAVPSGECMAAIERVHAGVFGGMKGGRMGVVSAFTFGGGYRALKMALTACMISYEEVVPAVWQGAIGCRTKGDKNVSKAKAQELFPNEKVTHAIADALLIAEWLRRQERR